MNASSESGLCAVTISRCEGDILVTQDFHQYHTGRGSEQSKGKSKEETDRKGRPHPVSLRDSKNVVADHQIRARARSAWRMFRSTMHIRSFVTPLVACSGGSAVTALILARLYIGHLPPPDTASGSWSGKPTGCFPIHILRLAPQVVNSAKGLKWLVRTTAFSSGEVRVRTSIQCSNGFARNPRRCAGRQPFGGRRRTPRSAVMSINISTKASDPCLRKAEQSTYSMFRLTAKRRHRSRF